MIFVWRCHWSAKWSTSENLSCLKCIKQSNRISQSASPEKTIGSLARRHSWAVALKIPATCSRIWFLSSEVLLDKLWRAAQALVWGRMGTAPTCSFRWSSMVELSLKGPSHIDLTYGLPWLSRYDVLNRNCSQIAPESLAELRLLSKHRHTSSRSEIPRRQTRHNTFQLHE